MRASFVAGIFMLAVAGVHCTSDSVGPGDAGLEDAMAPGDGGVSDGSGASGAPKDTVPPTFAGAATAAAISETQIAVTWKPATDDHTPQGTIAYRVYVGTSKGGEVYTTPFLTTPSGATGATLTALHAATPYWIVVRAVDAAGNEDANTNEVSAGSKDATPPVFAGVKKATGSGAHDVTVEWDAATDNGSAASEIHYEVFATTTQGGEVFTTPSATTQPGALTAKVSGLPEATPVFVVVRAVDASGNRETNKKEVATAPLDKTPPIFGGATGASALGTSIVVKWNAASDSIDVPQALKYDVFLSKTPGGQSFAAPTYTTVNGATSFSAINLDVSTTYYFVVRAKDSSGNEETNTVERSATTAASADVTPPTFAGLAAATPTSDTTIDLSWAAAADDTSSAASIVYDIFVSSGAGGEVFSSPSYTTAAGATSFTLTGLQPLQTSYVVVRARDEVGNEDANAVERSATTRADTIPPSFGGLSTATATGPTSVQLGWVAATDDVSLPATIAYRVFQATSAGGEAFGAPVATTAPGVTTIAINGLTPQTPYYFVVRAVDEVGNSDSNTIEKPVTTQADNAPPTFAGIGSLLALGPTSLEATWSPASDNVTDPGAIVYLPYLATSSGGQNFAIPPAPTAPGATNFTFTNLTPNTAYYVVIRARDAAAVPNTDANVVEKSATTLADVTAPVFAGALSADGATDSSLTLTWSTASDNVTAPVGITYLICMTTSNGGCNGAAFTTTTSVTGATTLPFTGLVPNTTYYFVVRARDAASNVDGNSVQVSGQTTQDVVAPTFGGLVSAVPNGDASILLTWNAASDNISTAGQIVYDIYQASSPGGETFGGPTYTTAAGATSFAIPNPPPLLAPQTPYWFVVRARDTAGNRDTNVVEKTATTAPDTTPPTFGGVTSVTNPTLTHLLVNWNAATDDITPSGNIVYLVCWSTGNACTTSFTAMATTAAGVSSYDIGGLLANTTYNVVVRARDAAATPNVDGNVIVRSKSTLADVTAPVFPAAPTIIGSSATSLTVKWSQATDDYSANANLRYRICMTQLNNGCGGAGGPFTTTVGPLTNVLQYQFTSLAPTSTYYFVVRAEDEVPNLDANYNIISGITVNDTTAPTWPGGFVGLQSAVPAAGVLGDSHITLSWQAASDNVSTQAQLVYDVYQGTSSGGEPAAGSPTYTSGAGHTSITVPLVAPNLQPQTTYYFIVRARDTAGNRDTNAVEKSATTNADAVAPTFGGITGLVATSDSQLTASWTAATDDTTAQGQIVYQVCWATTAACTTTFSAMATTAAGATSYTTPQYTLKQNQSYTFVVRALDTHANADTNVVTRSASTLVDNTVPTFAGVQSVTNVAGASPIPQTSLLASWNAASDDATTAANMRYDVCWAASPAGCTGASFVALQTVTGTTSYQIGGLSPNKAYNVVVRARDENNNSNSLNNNVQVAGTTAADSVKPTWPLAQAGLQTATSNGPTTIDLSWTAATDDFSSATQITYYVYEASPVATTIASGLAGVAGTNG
jgi:hypothetical protein